MDYLYFLYGLVLILLAVLARQLRRQSGATLAWRWFEGFALAYAFHGWLDALDFSLIFGGPLYALRLASMAAAYFCLLEFGRASGRRLGARGPGRWIHLPVLAVAFSGAASGYRGLFFSVPYALGLTAGAWAAWAFWRGARLEGRRPGPLRLAAAVMALFTLTTPFCSLRGSYPPVSFINDETFRALFHVSVHFPRILLMAVLAFALWRRQAHLESASLRDPLLAGIRLPGAPRWLLASMVITVAFGWLATKYIDDYETNEQLAFLAARTRIAATTLDPQWCARLDPASQDAAPERRLLQDRLKRLCDVHADICHVFLVGERGGKAVCLLAAAESPSGADVTPIRPGEPFAGDGAALLRALREGRPFVEFPISGAAPGADCWARILAPLEGLDEPHSSVMLGVCVRSQPWLRHVAFHHLTTITIVMLLILLQLGFFLAQDRARRAAARIAASERRYRILVEDSPNCVSLLDFQGRILTLNRIAQRALGRDEDEVFGLPFEAVWPAEMRSRVQDAVARALAGEALRFESEFSHTDGRITFLDVSLNPVSEDGAAVTHVIAIGVNISAQKRAEKVLRESEEMFRAVTENTLDAIIMMDPEGRISLWNQAAKRIFGYSAAEALGLDMHSLIAPRRYEPIYGPAVERYRLTGWGDLLGHSVEVEGRRRDGSEFPVEISLSSVTLNGRRHAVGIVRDITERKAFEGELHRSQAALEATNQELAEACERAGRLAQEAAQANAAKSAFLANMSHEIRTPMNGVLGMTALLLGTRLGHDQQEYAAMIKASAEHLLALIDDILDFSRIEARKLRLETIDFDLRAVVEEMNDLLALKAIEKGLDYASLIEPAVPGLLRGDPGRLRQVLTNLVGNAIKFTQRGEVRIRVSLAGDQDGAALLRFEVGDTGIGIPADKLAALFAPFTQGDSSITRRFGGSGLGLSISKDLAEMMGGRIGVESEPGVGSTFWFTARLETRPESEDPRVAAAAPLRGRRVLLVGRVGFSRFALRHVMEGWGMRCAEAGGMAEALQALLEAARAGDPFDAAIVEAILPDGDGGRLLKSVQAEPELALVRMILLHPVSEHRDAPRLRELGFAACLTRPVKTAHLLECLLGAPLAPEGGSAGAAVSDAGFRLRRRGARILLVEDNAINQKVALKTVERLGLWADVVGNGVEALAALRSSRYDLVLMDVQMPHLDGLEATRRIRAGHDGLLDPQTPIVAMTAHAARADQENCLAAGMNDYLAKPLDLRELERVLDRWLPEREGLILGAAPEPDEDPGVPQSLGPRTAPSAPPLTPVNPAPPQPNASPSLSIGHLTLGNNPQSDPPLFDRAAVLNRLGGDEELLTALLKTFLEDAPNQLQDIDRALAAEDPALLRIVAHNLKGAAAAVGVESLRQALQQLETAALSGQLAHAPGLLQAARGAFSLAEPILMAEADR